MLNVAQLARMDINLLLVFDLLFEERNAGRTAARLNLTPSAISHALRRLRALLDDPLFLAAPKGMMPTDRAQALAPAIRDIVERVHAVFASAQQFDPATTVRRFRIGAPDGAVSIIVPLLVKRLEKIAPGIDLSILQLLPRPGSIEPLDAWRDALAEIESGRISLAILPHQPSEARFHSSVLYFEDFVIVTRRGHPLTNAPSLKAFAAARHVLVSATGDSWGFVDRNLAEHGLERRIVLTVPSFFMAISAIASSDLVGALPRQFARRAELNHDIEIVEPPLDMLPSDLHAVVPRAAMLDHGIKWLLSEVEEVARAL
jgi:DNA-binding transcriptional LysR family regulator